jgi:hypothetical protein
MKEVLSIVSDRVIKTELFCFIITCQTSQILAKFSKQYKINDG